MAWKFCPMIRTQYDLTDYLLKRANLARTGNAGFTLVMLSTFVNSSWTCWPSVQTLADRMGANPKTVHRHMGYLESIGWVSKTKGQMGSNTNLHNIYTINLERIMRESTQSD